MNEQAVVKNSQQLTKEGLWLGGNEVKHSKVIQKPRRQEDEERSVSYTGSPLYQEGPALGELTPFVNDLNANASSRCWLEVKGEGNEIRCFPTFVPSSTSPFAPLTGFTIHFWRLLLSHALRRSLASWGRIKDWGKKLNSFLPKRLCMRDRFRHSRSFLPIWKEPGKWFSYRRDKRQAEGKGRGETKRNKISPIPSFQHSLQNKIHIPF